MRVAAQGTADHPGGPLGVFLRMAAIPLAAALALVGQGVLSRPGGYSRSLLPGAALLALALALLIFVLARGASKTRRSRGAGSGRPPACAISRRVWNGRSSRFSSSADS